MLNKYRARLIRKESTALQTDTFHFETPPRFQFTAGQSVEITLPLLDAPESDRTHTFSICSAPFEDYLAITTRLRDTPFKRALGLLAPSDSVEIEGPYGKFVVPQDTPRPIVFLIGGVGITPVISIIKQMTRDGGLTDVFLFYSNRSQVEAPFLTELEHLQTEHSEFQLVALMTADDSWNGENGRISVELVRRFVDPSSASFYAAGPPGMVKAMRELLAAMSVEREQIRIEGLSGY